MEKKIFKTSVEESKIIALKEVTKEKGIITDNMIEKLVDEYIEKNNKSLQIPINLDTKLEPKIIDALIRDGLIIDDYKVLMIKKTRYIYKIEHFKKYSIYNEEVVEIDLKDNTTGKLYFVAYTYFKTVYGYKIQDLYFIDSSKRYGDENVLRGMDYVYNKKFDFEKEIFINGIKIKLIGTSEYPNYRLEKFLLYTL